MLQSFPPPGTVYTVQSAPGGLPDSPHPLHCLWHPPPTRVLLSLSDTVSSLPCSVCVRRRCLKCAYEGFNDVTEVVEDAFRCRVTQKEFGYLSGKDFTSLDSLKMHTALPALKASLRESQTACGWKRCSCMFKMACERNSAHTNTHTHTYMCECVCVWWNPAHSKTRQLQLWLPQKLKYLFLWHSN